MYSKEKLKSFYVFDFFLGLILFFVSLLTFLRYGYFEPLSLILGLLVLLLAYVGYASVDKYYDKFYGKKAVSGKKRKKKRKR